jgi:diacylglycerol kinase family enzyme
MAWRALRGRIEETPKLHAFCAERLEIKPQRPSIDAVIDGEIVNLRAPLKVEIEKNALLVVRPRPADAEAEPNSLAKAEG